MNSGRDAFLFLFLFSFSFSFSFLFMKEQVVVGCDAVAWECEWKSMLVEFG